MDIIGICISFIEILTIFLIYNILINDRIFQGIFKIGILSIITSLTYSLFVTIYSTDPLIILIGVLFLNSMLRIQ